ncbi:MAG: glycosyltransferase [Caulobacteraceae bacterium]
MLAGLALAVWIYLLAGRGGFWRTHERDEGAQSPSPAAWPSVAVVVPARNEADVVGRAIASLLAQDYSGGFTIVLVDDGSEDGTGDLARALNGDGRLRVVDGAPPPAGWTGKPWAMQQGVAAAGEADWLWLTDADIAHDPDNLTGLIARAEAERLAMISQMAKLSVETWPEKLLIPAFVFFFAMLYPFAWVNDPRRRTAAAAGGCVLVRREALALAGGVEAIRGALIDDCALAARIKAVGSIRLELTDRARSLRPYARFGAIAAMVSRSAYAQLRYSPWLLIGTVVGMGIVYLAAPLLAVFGHGAARWLGAAAWLAMAAAYQPMLRFYRLPSLYAVALPAIGAIYTGFTVLSAAQASRGRGGLWKGRVQAMTAPR